MKHKAYTPLKRFWFQIEYLEKQEGNSNGNFFTIRLICNG
jgi:hypothetical protein